MIAQRRARAGIILAVLLAALVGVSGCADDSTEAGLGVPTVSDLELSTGTVTALQGTIWIAGNGCFHLKNEDGTYFIVWPREFQQDADQVFVQLGDTFTDGDPVTGMGRILDVAAAVAAAGGPDGYVGSVTGYCAEKGEQIAAFGEIRHA
ncbi:MAG: hypothetical protein JWR33_979 [Naasia sp.]|jgi:hypothetical protein|uniref:hypothetical protein n=1 Tax=Naasia sp. TaxID=2546198 RepID=UPI00261E5A87|nr:hypothetical protein [Naasia sp.]MCU1570238.1 hypothetical protein [Naasia sp.]